MTDEPKIIYNPDGSLSTLVGREAVDLMRLQTVISGIRMNIQTGGKMQLTRSATISNLIKIAETYTKKKYNFRKAADKQQAMDDLTDYFNLLKSTIPTETR